MRVYCLAGIKTEQVRDVTVILLRLAVVEVIIVLLKPFFEKSCFLAYAEGLELNHLILHDITQFFVCTECLACRNKVVIKLFYKALLLGFAYCHRSVFG